jgi:rhamnose transport system ATP-binding protein
MEQTPLIVVRDLRKSFGGVHALRGVTLDIQPAEIHALCGENGAGKSTLIKALAGSVTPDSGAILVNGSRLAFGSVRASEQAGIAVIHQESVAFPHLSAIDNIFVGREPRRAGGLLLDRPRMKSETRQLLKRLGEHFDPACPVGELSVAQRQMVGMARALSQKCRLLIMDEPTASLSERETRVLFALIRQLQSAGVAILYVSHRLDEIFALSSQITVLRDGQSIATHATAGMNKDRLIQLMVGRELAAEDEAIQNSKFKIQNLERRLQVRDLSRSPAFQNVSFDVRAGEIVGMAGLVGAGRSEVARVIFGADAADSGRIIVDKQPLPIDGNTIDVSMKRGIALVPEDRQHLGLVLPMSVGTNIALAILQQLTTAGLTSRKKQREAVAPLMKSLAVKAASQSVPANTLSGGNQQKLVLAKWLATNPRILILDEPTRGVDVGAKAEIHRLIRELTQQGMATLVISSDLPEVLAISDRILVMRNGAISGELSRADATQEKILSLAIPRGSDE